MTKRQQVIALLALGWSFRRIERETGVRRATVSRYSRPGDPKAAKAESKAAKAFAGSHGPARSSAAPFRDAILEKLEQGLTVQRVFQDLQEEYGYAQSYESVKRYVRKLERPRRAVGVMHTIPGEESLCGTPHSDSSPGIVCITPTARRGRSSFRT